MSDRLVLFAASIAALVAAPAQAGGAAPDDERQRELVHIVRQDCGSCHGLTLAGGLGPALTPATLRDKPVEGLVVTIVGGRPGTPMPPFRGIVSEGEAQWIVERLIEGFPSDPGPAGGSRAPR
ncbi:c-type cytochrome [Aromatoleum sp.]|uniref:c-type cytochrome n=1 Tax=Aromatoleum sp. TaxID=2307007 RepID=UPI002FC6F1E9